MKVDQPISTSFISVNKDVFNILDKLFDNWTYNASKSDDNKGGVVIYIYF